MYRGNGSFGKSTGEAILKSFPVAAALLIPGLLFVASPSARQHTVRLTGEVSNGHFRFSPARVTVQRGDTLVFMVESGGPHALGVDPAGVSPPLRAAWNRALPRRTGALRGPLIRAGQPYAIVVPREMEPGKYTFFCLAHRAYDMKLELDVK